MPVRELELELDAFEGPFDLLLTLLLKEELEPREIDIAAIVLALSSSPRLPAGGRSRRAEPGSAAARRR